jgi:hypothetical protein
MLVDVDDVVDELDVDVDDVEDESEVPIGDNAVLSSVLPPLSMMARAIRIPLPPSSSTAATHTAHNRARRAPLPSPDCIDDGGGGGGGRTMTVCWVRSSGGGGAYGGGGGGAAATGARSAPHDRQNRASFAIAPPH